MAQTGYTPILIYSSSTAAAAPAAGSLTNSTLGSELAINITDGKLFYKDNANAVQVIGWKTVPTTAGGTGLTSYTAGDLIYYVSGTAFTKLAIGASGRWLGSSGTAPQWNAPAALTETDDTNVTLTLGGSPSTALLNAVSMTLGWTGTLAVSRGGTGLASFTANQVFYASSTSAVAQSANLTFNGTTLTVNDLTDSSLTANRVVYASTGGNLVTSANLTFDGTTFTHTGASNFATSTGNLGIGTSSPATKLQVSNGYISQSDGTVTTYLGSDGTGSLFGTTTNHYLRFITNNTERARITSGGDFGINSTSPAAKLDVIQDSASANGGRVAYFRSTASGDVANNAVIISKFDNNTTTSQIFMKFEVNNTATSCGRINANGANTAAFGSTSDQRVKENIADLPPQLQNILALRPVEFDYLGSYGGGHQIGFIAQEMQQVYPDVVSADESEEKILSITGWSKTEARLVRAIQELKAELDATKAEIAQLKGAV